MYYQSMNDFPEAEHLALFAPLQNDKSPFKCVTIFTVYIVIDLWFHWGQMLMTRFSITWVGKGNIPLL